MARPSWSGAISFGMVSIPVKLVTATRSRSVSFNQLDAESMSRIRYRKVAEATEREVPPDQIVRAVDTGGGSYVVIEDDDLEALTPQRSRELAIEAFVPESDIDPLAFESSYYVLPDASPKPYALLTRALEGTERVGIGRFVMRRREHLAAVRSDGEKLLLSTMVFPDEVIDPADFDELRDLDEVEVADKELKMASSLVQAMSDELDPDAYRDEYREAVEQLVESKAEGRVTVAPGVAHDDRTVLDLTEALEASLEAAKEGHKARSA